MINRFMLVGLLVAGICISAIIANVGQAKDISSRYVSAYETIVDEKGNINLPQADFRRDWTMLGAWVVNGEAQAAGLHNVYAQPGVVERYRETGKFPDGTILVKELINAATGDYTTGRISFANDVYGWFVMVKDTEGRFKDSPIWGHGWGWAYFEAKTPGKPLTKNYNDECLTCHIPAEDTDWVYTEAYPVLGPNATDTERFRAILAEMLSKPQEKDSSHDSEAVAASAAEAKAGKKVFRRCASCHSVEVGKNKSGPTLAGVYGRKAGSVDGFNYSDAMKSSQVVWNDETLNKHLSDVPNFIPGNRMGKVFKNGVQDARDRQAIIEYLKTK